MRQAAFFDIDGTLVDCQTQEVLSKILREEKLLSQFEAARIFGWFLAYKLGLVRSSVQLRARCYQTLSLRPKPEIDRIFSQASEEIRTKYLRPWMKRRVDRHKAKDELVFALTGSLSSLTEPIGREFQIEWCFSTQLSVADGRYTGAWEGEILEGENKVKIMKELAQKYGIDLNRSAAYADSFSDLPMLKAVGCPIAISPDRRLKRYALKRHWEILEARACV